MAQNNIADREIVITRIINAPQALVFHVWTDPKHIDKWWGPKGFTNTTYEIDIRPGGVWRYMMHGPDGVDYPNRMMFKEVTRPERLVYDHDSDIDNDPEKFEATVTFEKQGDKTKLTLRTIFSTAEKRKMVIEKYHAIEGGNQTIDRFEDRLAKTYYEADAEADLVITREFNAPRALVFKAFTEADALAQWWGPVGFKMGHIKLDLRPGGTFHYSMSAENGFTMWGKFTYHEITPPDRIVFTNSFSDEAGNITRAPFFDGKWPLEVMNILTLTEHNGKTTLTLKGGPLNPTAEERKAFDDNRNSMQGGFKGTFDQLDEYLEKNQ